ncbi:MmcQ/YjbR family DNA-binding protein [Nocardioides sp. InS609-2]|uniref:MmcQ/YjbR family DNA-binding protein n=1 Tax=Nocardioides sp. InS609-2 TaxID=2760705 RepID=UPI0020BD4A2E|nr:MmcQ/YjbR family DNA-binding protein [Nocardioides sp. InS609-2]
MDVPADVVARLRAICDPLPGAYEEAAWAGIRFRVRGRTFVHCVAIAEGRPPAFSRHAGTRGPALALTFEAEGEELLALRSSGHPFWKPSWRPTVVGMFVNDDTDWAEVGELVTESYCVQAPKKLRAQVRAG